MPRTRAPNLPEFFRQIVELVPAGRTPEGLSREFETTAQTIHNWVANCARASVQWLEAGFRRLQKCNKYHRMVALREGIAKVGEEQGIG